MKKSKNTSDILPRYVESIIRNVRPLHLRGLICVLRLLKEKSLEPATIDWFEEDEIPMHNYVVHNPKHISLVIELIETYEQES